MLEFTLTFSGPKTCSHCGGPIGEVAYFDEHGAYCDSVCANGAAVEREGRDFQLSYIEEAERAVVEAAKALLDSEHIGHSPALFAYATMSTEQSIALQDFKFAVESLAALKEK